MAVIDAVAEERVDEVCELLIVLKSEVARVSSGELVSRNDTEDVSVRDDKKAGDGCGEAREGDRKNVTRALLTLGRSVLATSFLKMTSNKFLALTMPVHRSRKVAMRSGCREPEGMIR